jgi:hypothetical protein
MGVIGKFIFNDLTAIIADYKFYAENEQTIDNWLRERSSERTGMVIKFDSEDTKLMFMMRWV